MEVKENDFRERNVPESPLYGVFDIKFYSSLLKLNNLFQLYINFNLSICKI